MGVDHRRLDVATAEQLLNLPQVHVLQEQMRRGRMAQRVPERGEPILGDRRAVGRRRGLRCGGGFLRALPPAEPGGDGLSGLLDLPFLSAVPFQRVEKTGRRLIGRCVRHDGGAALEPADPTDVETGVLFVRDSAPEQVLTEGRGQRFGLSFAMAKRPRTYKEGRGGSQWAIFRDDGVRQAVPRRKKRLTKKPDVGAQSKEEPME